MFRTSVNSGLYEGGSNRTAISATASRTLAEPGFYDGGSSSTASPAVVLRSPAERRLCELYAQFNWEYLLTKDVRGSDRSQTFLEEEALVQ